MRLHRSKVKCRHLFRSILIQTCDRKSIRLKPGGNGCADATRGTRDNGDAAHDTGFTHGKRVRPMRIVSVFNSMNSSSPNRPSSRPEPLCLKPPNGISG